MSKEQERAELHRVIWNIANDLRGSVDGWDFKTYVLGMLFYRFISEDLTRYLNKLVAETGTSDFDYASLSDAEALRAKDQTVQEKGYFILPSELFQNVAKRAKNDDALNMTLDQVFKNIEGSAKGTPSEPDLKGLFSDFDVSVKTFAGVSTDIGIDIVTGPASRITFSYLWSYHTTGDSGHHRFDHATHLLSVDFLVKLRVRE